MAYGEGHTWEGVTWSPGAVFVASGWIFCAWHLWWGQHVLSHFERELAGDLCHTWVLRAILSSAKQFSSWKAGKICFSAGKFWENAVDFFLLYTVRILRKASYVVWLSAHLNDLNDDPIDGKTEGAKETKNWKEVVSYVALLQLVVPHLNAVH